MIADRFLGASRAVMLGGIVIACGHFSMAAHSLTFFYTGLGLIVIGTAAQFSEQSRAWLHKRLEFQVFVMPLMLQIF